MPWSTSRYSCRMRCGLSKRSNLRARRGLELILDSLRGDHVSYYSAIRENVMKIVPVIKSGDLERSVQFYTRILDFERKWPGHEDREMANGVIDLRSEEHTSELQ